MVMLFSEIKRGSSGKRSKPQYTVPYHVGMTNLQRWTVAANLLLAAAAGIYAAGVTEISLTTKELYPESITSLKDGTLIVGSVGQGNVWRIAPGSTSATEWIKPGTGGLNQVFGVLADEKSNSLWVCSNNLDGKGSPTAVRTFDLKTGAPKKNYDLPGQGAFCNDIAIASNGAAYIADTRLNTIFMLKKGAATLEVAAKDDKLAGADGLERLVPLGGPGGREPGPPLPVLVDPAAVGPLASICRASSPGKNRIAPSWPCGRSSAWTTRANASVRPAPRPPPC